MFAWIAVIPMVIKRTFNNLGLILATLLGLIVAVTILCSVPLYSDAINEQLLHEQFQDIKRKARPQPSLLFRYLGTQTGYIELPNWQSVDSYLMSYVEPVLGMTAQAKTRYTRGDNIQLFPPTNSTTLDPKQALRYGFLAQMNGIEDYINITEGAFPRKGGSADGDLEIMMTESSADKIGAKVGDRFIVYGQGYEKQPVQANVRITGLWAAKDPSGPEWFYDPTWFEDALFMDPDAYMQQVLPLYQNRVFESVWYMRFNGADVHSTNALNVLGGIYRVSARANSLLPGLRLDDSPEVLLIDYEQNAYLLRILLYVFSVPVIAIVLYFIALSSSLVVERQRNEIAVLKSRGASTFQVIGIYLTEGLIIGAIAIAIGPFLGTQVAQLIGRTYTFLYFANRAPLPVTLTLDTFRTGGIAIVLSLLASMIPAAGAARFTIVSYKMDVARSTRRPFYQRYFLDVLLLGISLYGYYMLSGQGSILVPETGGTGDPFKNPLLLLVPAIFIFALALVVVRLFPYFVAGLSWVASLVMGVPILLGLRHIARSPGYYTNLILLITVTIALGSFSASVAKTLDRNYRDRVYYSTGGDMKLSEWGEYNEAEDYWTFQPVWIHRTVDGVLGAARVGVYTARVGTAGRSATDVNVVGVDREDFLQVAGASWRRDYASLPLGYLMNSLAAKENGLIVDTQFLYATSQAVGDQITLTIRGANMPFVIEGTADYVPTMYPDKGHFFLANLQYIFDQLNGPVPYDVWLTYNYKDSRITPKYIQDELSQRDIVVIDAQDAPTLVETERRDPSRTGLFGILSVGFIVATLLAVLGFLLYSFISFRRRFIQLGVLRALGLSVGQLMVLLLFEQLFIVLIGVLAGTAIGVQTGNMFIPFMQIGETAAARVPPFVVTTAWEDIFKIYVVVGAMFGVGTLAMMWLLSHMKIHQAVKLGGTME